MDYLWTPWRYSYVTAADRETGCIFCDKLQHAEDRDAYIVYRGKQCFVCLNTFPYTSGHVMVVPYQHVNELRKLSAEAANEMTAISQRLEGVLHDLYCPDGLNIGMNIGKAAGAGIEGHIHLHILPRWVGDTNFMTVTAETRVLPETLEITWRRISDAMK